jgi:hypothetical protein
MTVLTPRRGGPSQLHEARVETLTTLATLSGFEFGPDVLPAGARPDVLLLRARDGAIFVGDAKATETPGNKETYERLMGYAEFLATWICLGQPGVMALAVDAADADRWLRTLRDLCLSPSDGCRVPGRVDFIDAATAVIWQGFVGRHE